MPWRVVHVQCGRRGGGSFLMPLSHCESPRDGCSPLGLRSGHISGQAVSCSHCPAAEAAAFRDSWGSFPGRQSGARTSVPDLARLPGCLQKCERCQRMGATLQCHSEGCPRRYHFPCAAASGSFQSMKTLRLLCPEHLAEAAQMGGCCWVNGWGGSSGFCRVLGGPDSLVVFLAVWDASMQLEGRGGPGKGLQ